MIKLIDALLYGMLSQHLAKKAGQEALRKIEQGSAFEAQCAARAAAGFAFNSHPYLRSF
jgi:hypothetical protein